MIIATLFLIIGAVVGVVLLATPANGMTGRF
jgi:hypothetical protein